MKTKSLENMHQNMVFLATTVCQQNSSSNVFLSTVEVTWQKVKNMTEKNLWSWLLSRAWAGSVPLTQGRIPTYRDALVRAWPVGQGGISSLRFSFMSLRMEQCAQFWATHPKRETEKSERAWRRAFKMVRGLERTRYWERLKKMVWFSTQKLKAVV